MKVLKGTPKHLSKTGELDSFTYLMMTLPFQCNYRCSKCFNLEDDKPISFSGNISLDDRIKVINEAKELGGKVVVIAGEGEPSIDKDIRTIVSEISSLGMIPIVYSNGSPLTPKLTEFYKATGTVLVIAFDFLIPEEYDRLTGTKGRYEGIVRKIRNVIKSYKGSIHTQGDLRVLSVAINTTVTSGNEREVEQIKKFWGDDVYFICNPLARFGNAVGNWNRLIDDERNVERHRKLIERLSESGGPLTLGSDGLCGYSVWGIGISPSGDYMTCAYTRETNGLFGNVKSLNLRDAFEIKHKLESEHYRETGKVPCLIRASSFSSYLDKLRSERKTE
ncbi:MAG TPA: radical SAM protein [Candidatus Nanoarchaeia archaeon]|nr:radical SAM protein [Candidatus Nanoarchaeia archaeon]